MMLKELISRTQRNHALEHATIHMLSERYRNFSAQGNSTHQGFYLNIYGDIPDTAVADAVHEAHRRMKAGEHQLAIHPNCGTVLLTTATMVVLASQLTLAMEQRRQRRSRMPLLATLEALPSAILAGVVALIVSRPVGLYLQEKFTTDGDLGDLRVVDVRKITPSPVTRIFRLLLAPGRELTTTAYRIDTTG
ncbi:MAG: hypothetical protein H6666_02190 [Ardenticatenaceae bacterium]|nr:hypothetical protein [Ardenticatenaceae bacterium]